MDAPNIVIVGAGFAGVEAARGLERALLPGEARITLVSPTDYQLYLPLLPHVAAGILTPQSVAPSLRRLLRRTVLVPGGVVGVDPGAKMCVVRKITGELVDLSYDYLVLTPGSVTRTFDIPGLLNEARGMKTLAQAVYLRDHVIAQLDLAAATLDEEERAARLQFVVVGGGYAGTETAATLQRLTTAAAKRYHPRLDPRLIKWHLVDIAPKLLPELGEKLGTSAMRMLMERGMRISLKTSVASVTEDYVTLTDGRVLPSRTLVWTAGVAASPLVDSLGAETVHGRLLAQPDFRVLGLDGVFALGDAAAVPDLAKGDGSYCVPTAQHAARQGRHAAKNLTALLRGEPMTPYKHKDLGLVVDLGGRDAVSKPLGIDLKGVPAQVVARGYHLYALRTGAARFRTGANWLLKAVAGYDFVRTGFLADRKGTLRDFEHTDVYLTPEEVAARTRY
ncbi:MULTISPECIES: NAD(P)/FAD-dependent oxidoreductase [Streptomyces]|uniref:NADH-quinone oxidoreductase subunit E n=1 Tax=Streptomyces dengpaensis TaxID=2049881 RepID=A0ABN5HWL2_9ACTN|nr:MULTISPECIES: FAD-dependent oxidoreductase [Streptomyces]AVH54931.1 NADH-quinone oxidoreductase subunit E [Streptomyces dengpaensis]PIB08230.1 NADH dehydrogenase [Streptomyces sp. HG99]